MNQANLSVRWRWLLVALLFLPVVARADPDYGGVYAALLVGLVVSVLLLAGVLWIIIADYRAGRPGIGPVNAAVSGVLLLGWLGSTVQHWSWLTLGLMALLGLNGWLVAQKNLRVAERQLPLWLAIGIVGLGWLVSAVMGSWVGLYPETWQWMQGNMLLLWPTIRFVLQLPALVLLVRAFFRRWPTEWPAQTVTISLRVAGIAAAIDAATYLLEMLSGGGLIGSSPDIWQSNLFALLRISATNLLQVGLVMLGVRWWLRRGAELT